jgi:cytochrome c oxidase subunit II
MPKIPPVRPKLLAGLCLAVGAGLAFAGAAVAGNGGLAPPPSVSPNGDRIRDSYFFIAIFTGAIFILVEGALILFLVRFRRRRRRHDQEGPQIRGNTNLELAWTVVPVLILVAIGAFVFYKIPGIEDPAPAAAADEHLAVTIQGRQFYWQFGYDGGGVSIDELVVPVNRTIVATLTAPDHDVIHSWWIPRLGGKRDAIPGATTDLWFRARREGVYLGACGEFCGIQHAAMRSRVRVVSQDEYEQYLDERENELGREEWEGVCQKCHSPQIAIGPPLAESPALQNEETVRAAVTEGRGEMPAVGKGWSDQQLDALMAYIREEVAPGGGQG